MRETTLLIAAIVVVFSLAPAAALGVISAPTLSPSSLATSPTTSTTSTTTSPSDILDPDAGDALTEPVDEAAADSDLAGVTLEEYEWVVGYQDALPYALIEALGGTVVDSDPVLKFAVVRTPLPGLLAALDGIAFVYAVPNGETKLAASQWDASQWDASQWDASQWDASQWDSTAGQASQWDASQWDASQWDASQWDASQWDASQWDASQWDGAPAQDPGFGNQWNLGAMHVDDAWTVTMGYHAKTVCVVDSGIDATHPDLARNVKRTSGSFGYDFVNGDNDPMDDGGHGTHIAGIVAAQTGNGQGIAGVSQAWLIAAKVLDAQGSGTESNLAKGIRWCADNGGNVIVMALHTDQDNPAVFDAVKYARNRGSLLVAASGNQGARCADCVAWPAKYDVVLAVGASAPDSAVAGFSNGGNDLDLVAPGVQISGPIPGGYAVGSGTSQAAANAAGAAALLWSAKPNLKADDVAGHLKSSAKDDGAIGFDYAYGAGHLRLDLAFKALKLL